MLYDYTKLDHLMKKTDTSNERLAVELECSYRTIENYRKNRTSPDVYDFCRVCMFFKKKPNYFFI